MVSPKISVWLMTGTHFNRLLREKNYQSLPQYLPHFQWTGTCAPLIPTFNFSRSVSTTINPLPLKGYFRLVCCLHLTLLLSDVWTPSPKSVLLVLDEHTS